MLNKNVFIYWGKDCVYQINKSSPANIYPLYFQPPTEGLADDAVFESSCLVYPEMLKVPNKVLSIAWLDEQAVDLYSVSPFQEIDSNKARDSDVWVVHKYMSEGESMQIAVDLGVPFTVRDFYIEQLQIFSLYFKPSAHVGLVIEQVMNQLVNPVGLLSLGMHVRATDKLIETPVPSINNYIKTARKYCFHHSIFVATDSSRALDSLSDVFSVKRLIYQHINRSNDSRGSHLTGVNSHQNGIDMIVDIEILARCSSVIAFPGSQIYWWLNMMSKASSSVPVLIPVLPNAGDWLRSIAFSLKVGGLPRLLWFLRHQKGGIRNLSKTIALYARRRLMSFARVI